jgi:hypothetical protein
VWVIREIRFVPNLAKIVGIDPNKYRILMGRREPVDPHTTNFREECRFVRQASGIIEGACNCNMRRELLFGVQNKNG